MRILKRITFGFLAVIAALVVFLAASILVDAALGRERMNAVTNTSIPGQNGEPAVRAYVATPDGAGPFPVVIMIHEFWGLNASIVGKAEGLAEAGYLVIAPDTFRGATTDWIPRAIYQVVATPQEQVNRDLDAVFAWIEAQPEADANRVGIAGFCYGGRTALMHSLHNPRLAATVVFYGSPETDPQVLRSLPGPLLGIFGEADRSIPVDRVRAFEAALDQAGIENEITIYPDQPHAFVTDIEAIRRGGVQSQAWAQMLAFLDDHLKPAGASRDTGPGSPYTAPFAWKYYWMLVYEHTFGGAVHQSGSMK